MTSPDDVPSWIQFFAGLGIIAAIGIVAIITAVAWTIIDEFVTNWKTFKEWKQAKDKGEI